MKNMSLLCPSLRIAICLAGLARLPSAFGAADAPAVIRLWEGGAPGFESRKDMPEIPVQYGIAGINNPSLTVFLPAPGKATGAGVVILPGGGHRYLNVDVEGYALARWLASKGIAGFVLKYRLARDQTVGASPYRIKVEEMQDATRAMRLVRSRAAEWGADSARIGIIGFSAGGYLAARVAMLCDAGDPAAADPVERASSKPAFQALVYPGEPEEIEPTKDSPPAFLVAGTLDSLADGLSLAWLRFKKAGVPVELHIYSGVGHAFNFRPNPHTVGTWGDRLYDWIADNGFLKPGG
ncbi:MAG TPA: alpha/beta hydrolase [Opitutaceae bacterium]|nr:alpha/beta hydrolase [Opitutaceae bacterium]